MERPTTVVKAKDEVVGVRVYNNEDDNLGEIREVMLDKDTGQVAYLVLESDAIFGMGGKLFALPWHAIHYDAKEDCFRLNIDKDRFKNAPGFDKDHWPNMADKAWGKTVSSYYNAKGYWE